MTLLIHGITVYKIVLYYTYTAFIQRNSRFPMQLPPLTYMIEQLQYLIT